MALVSGGKAFHAKALLYNTLFINNVLCGWGTFIVATSCPLVGSCLVSLYGSRSFLLYASLSKFDALLSTNRLTLASLCRSIVLVRGGARRHTRRHLF